MQSMKQEKQYLETSQSSLWEVLWPCAWGQKVHVIDIEAVCEE